MLTFSKQYNNIIEAKNKPKNTNITLNVFKNSFSNENDWYKLLNDLNIEYGKDSYFNEPKNVILYVKSYIKNNK